MLEALLSPLRVGPVELPNRIVSTAHQTTLVHEHVPTEDFVAYHEARARGGTGLIVLEATAVESSGLLTPHTLAGYRDEVMAGFARVAEAVRPHGTKLFVQLFHGGREQIASPPRTPAISASAIPSRRFHVEPRAATTADIEAILEGYGRSAANVAGAGLDGVEISAAHNYLAAQFVVATGARPYVPAVTIEGVMAVQAWDVLAGHLVDRRRVVVADWGGDASGLAAAELLAAAGSEVTLALGSAAFGESIHPYRPARPRPRKGSERGLADELRALGLAIEEAGDCLSPRSAEEAILEGTLAVAGPAVTKIR